VAPDVGSTAAAAAGATPTGAGSAVVVESGEGPKPHARLVRPAHRRGAGRRGDSDGHGFGGHYSCSGQVQGKGCQRGVGRWVDAAATDEAVALRTGLADETNILFVFFAPADVRTSQGAAVVATDQAAPATATVREKPTDSGGAVATTKTEATNGDKLIASAAPTNMHSADAAEAVATGRRWRRRTRRLRSPPPSTQIQPTPMGLWPPNDGHGQRQQPRQLGRACRRPPTCIPPTRRRRSRRGGDGADGRGGTGHRRRPHRANRRQWDCGHQTTDTANGNNHVNSDAPADVHSTDAAEAVATRRLSWRRKVRLPLPPPSAPSRLPPTGRLPPAEGRWPMAPTLKI